MASAQGLLNLVSQLQSMETSFASILMEAAMKLSALTDASIFVLVETQEGRKFSGKRHLCDAYMAGLLTPMNSDVEMEVNPLVSALQQVRHQGSRTSGVPIQPRPTAASYVGSPAVFPAAVPVSPFKSPAGNRKRPVADTSLSSPHMKVSRPTVSSPSTSLPSLAQQKGSSISAQSRLVDDEIVSVNVKEEADEEETKDCEHRASPVRDEDGIELVDSENESFGGQGDPQAGLDVIPWLPHLSNTNHNDLYLSTRQPSTTHANSNPFEDEALLLDVSADKLEALQTLPPTEIFVKGTVGYRVLNSVLYEIGRSIAQTCVHLGLNSPKDPESKTIFSSCFDKWIADNLAHLASSEKRLENFARSPLGFMKQNARVHFYKVFSTLLKDKTKSEMKTPAPPLYPIEYR